jgi:hypothetical protein
MIQIKAAAQQPLNESRCKLPNLLFVGWDLLHGCLEFSREMG